MAATTEYREDMPAPSKSPSRSGGPVQRSTSPITVTGTVEAGVESNCLLLGGYLLLGGDRAMIQAGARVSVTGRPEPDTLTTCQQGMPLRVDSVTAA